MTTTIRTRPPRVLAIRSAGGHRARMLRMTPAFAVAGRHHARPDARAPVRVVSDAGSGQVQRSMRRLTTLRRSPAGPWADAIAMTGMRPAGPSCLRAVAAAFADRRAAR